MPAFWHNPINFYNWGLQGKPFFLLYIHLWQSSLLLYIWHFIFRNGDRAALFNEYRTSCLCFLCLDFSGSVGKVERGYSDAGFRDCRVPFCSSDIPSIAKYLWLCSVITDSVLRHPHWEDILDSSLHRSASFGFTAEAYLKLCVCGRMLSFVCEPRSLVYSPIHIVTAFGRVIPHFSVAKLVCSRVRLKALVNGVASQIFLYRAGGFDGLRWQK